MCTIFVIHVFFLISFIINNCESKTQFNSSQNTHLDFENEISTSRDDNYKLLLESGKADTFPETTIGTNGIPTCMPDEKLINGLYLNNVNTENNIGMPPWFNATLGKIGQNWIQENLFSAFLGPLSMSLLQFFSYPNINRLVNPNESIAFRTPERGATRLIATIIQHHLWFSQDLYGPEVQKSLKKVRTIHMKAAHKARNNSKRDIRKPIEGFEEEKRKNMESRMWRAFVKDVAPLKSQYMVPERVQVLRDGRSDEIPFNMFDMVEVSTFILCPSLALAEKYGVKATEEQMAGYIHLWSGITHGLGLDDSFNVALKGDVIEIRRYCKKHIEINVLPGFVNMDEETMVALDLAIQEAMLIFPYINTKAGWLYFFFDVFNLPAPNLKRVTGVVGRGFNGALDPILRPALKTRFGARIANFYMMSMYRVASRKYLGVDLNNMKDVAENGYLEHKY